MTDHPLTDERIEQFRDRHIDPYLYAQEIFDAGREYERTNPADNRPWEPLGKDDPVSVGDEVRRDFAGMTTIAVVGRARTDKNLYTTEGSFIGFLGSGTWHVRRAARELPTKFGAVIVPAEGHETITATDPGRGTVWRAREAVCTSSTHWTGAWRDEDGNISSIMRADLIDADTWQEDNA